MRVSVVSFGPERECPPTVARLHAELLRGDPLAAAGPLFLEHFYYRHLPRDGGLFGAVAVVEGREAGFVALSPDPWRTLDEGKRRYRGEFAAVAMVSLLRRPLASLTAWRRLRRRGTFAPGPPGTGELVALAVLPELRGPREDLDGRSLAHALLARAVLRLRDEGYRGIRARVAPDDARAARFFVRERWTRREPAGPEARSRDEWSLDWGG